MAEARIYDEKKAVQLVADELEQLKGRIIGNMRSAGEVASGRTIRSLRVISDDAGAALISAQDMPFGVLETGRRGGKVPYMFSNIIYQWMQDKGVHGTIRGTIRGNGTQEKADRSMAFAISRNIAQRGSSLFRRGGRSDIYSNEIPSTVAHIVSRIAASIDLTNMIPLNNIGD